MAYRTLALYQRQDVHTNRCPIGITLDFFWFLEIVKENTRDRKYGEKVGEKKNKNIIKSHILFLLTSFYILVPT